jgi:large subunit ribosomal protein L5e
MAFVKLVKNKAYFKRFQVKYRRRREGKTDYYARKRLVAQDKNKYNSPKYRFVVRFSNKDISCQVMSSKIAGDICHTAAYAHELKRYGLPAGLTNYAAAYCTGLLCARRLLNKYGLDTAFPGQEEIDGEFEEDFIHNEQDEDGPAAFHALLDVGLKCTTLGSKLFAAMKGAFDGGLEIPHSEKKFFGYDPDGKEYDAAEHRDRIFGGHVRDYMESREADDPEKYATHFSQFIAAGVGCDDLEELYGKVHTAIKEDPTAKLTDKKVPELTQDLKALRRDVLITDSEGNTKFVCRNKRSKQQREDRIKQLKAHTLAKIAEEESEEDEDDEDDDE